LKGLIHRVIIKSGTELYILLLKISIGTRYQHSNPPAGSHTPPTAGFLVQVREKKKKERKTPTDTGGAIYPLSSGLVSSSPLSAFDFAVRIRKKERRNGF